MLICCTSCITVHCHSDVLKQILWIMFLVSRPALVQSYTHQEYLLNDSFRQCKIQSFLIWESY